METAKVVASCMLTRGSMNPRTAATLVTAVEIIMANHAANVAQCLLGSQACGAIVAVPMLTWAARSPAAAAAIAVASQAAVDVTAAAMDVTQDAVPVRAAQTM